MNKFFSILAVLSLVSSVSAQTISPDLFDKWEDEVRVECIIVMKDQLDLYGRTNGMTKDEKASFVYNSLTAHAHQSQRMIANELAQMGVTYKSFFAFNGIHTWLTIQEAEFLINKYEIERILPNVQTRVVRPYTADADIATARTDAEWGITQIKADTVWERGYRGAGVIIAGQDTGYDYENPAILSKYQGYSEDTIIHDYSWHDAIHELNPLNEDTDNDPSNNPCGLSTTEPCDDNAHGSHTMGTMVGGNDTLKIGVAPDAKWIACRNMDRGWGSPVTYTECYEWFLAPTDINGENPDPTKAPHVINNSWGCPPKEGCNPDNFFMMETVVNNLTAAGTVVVVSAGNDGTICGTISNPSAIFENSFAVGASRQDDSKAIFSSIGPVLIDSSYRIKPDIVAPGVNVLSINNQGGFNSWGGTSMAGPHVAGAVALIISANPDLAGQVDVIKDIIKSTAVTLVDSMECGDISALDVPNFHFGHGRIDVLAAVEMALNIPCTVEAGDDFTVCNPYDTLDVILLNGELISANIDSYSWSSDNYTLGTTTYDASDMLSDTSILSPELTDHFDRTEVYYLTGTTNTGVTCVDSVIVNFSDWMFLTIDPVTGKGVDDTVGIYSIAESNWPSDYLWSPDFNISDVTDATPQVWNDTTQYYDLLITDSLGCQVMTGYKVNVFPECMIEAGDDIVICSEDMEQDKSLNGALLSGGFTNWVWSSDPTHIGPSTYHASDMLSDTTILNPEITDHFDKTEVFYLTGFRIDGEVCVDSVTVNFSDWIFVTIDPVSGKKAEDTIGIYAIGESNWPSDYLWSPDYNISDVTDSTPQVWNDTTQYYDLLVTDSVGCQVEIGWLVNVTTTATNNPDQLIDIDVAPNPNHGNFTLSSTEGVIQSVEIFDITGKRVSVISGTSNSIAIDGLGSGTYVYRAKVGDKLGIGKVVVIGK